MLNPRQLSIAAMLGDHCIEVVLDGLVVGPMDRAANLPDSLHLPPDVGLVEVQHLDLPSPASGMWPSLRMYLEIRQGSKGLLSGPQIRHLILSVFNLLV